MTLSLAAAVAGAFLAHKFGRNKETDGFMAAYGVYLVLVLGAQSFRMVVVPDLTRAEAEGRLGAETRAYAFAFVAVAIPPPSSRPPSRASGASCSPAGCPSRRRALPQTRCRGSCRPPSRNCWRRSLRARWRPETATSGGRGFRPRRHRRRRLLRRGGRCAWLVSLAWGLALNGAIAIGLPAIVLLLRGNRLRLHRTVPLRLGHRLWRLLQGAAVPIAVQGLYVIALRFAAGTGEGNVTSLSYAYLLAGTFVTATAFSLSLISAAPLTRRGVDAESCCGARRPLGLGVACARRRCGRARRVDRRPRVTAVLGDAFSGHVGDELGGSSSSLSPWMVASAAFSITYPLLFVMHRTRQLLPLALACVLVDIPISIAGRALWGLTGVTVALGVSTLLLVLGLMPRSHHACSS